MGGEGEMNAVVSTFVSFTPFVSMASVVNTMLLICAFEIPALIYKQVSVRTTRAGV